MIEADSPTELRAFDEELVEQAIDDEHTTDDAAASNQKLASLSVLALQDHLNWSIVQDEDQSGLVLILGQFLVVVQTVGVGEVLRVIYEVDEGVRNQLQEVEVLLHIVCLLHLIVSSLELKHLLSAEHVEDGVLTVVDGAKRVNEHLLVRFRAKCHFSDPVIHLQLLLESRVVG